MTDDNTSIDAALDALLDPSAEPVTVPVISDTFRISETSVLHAIRTGKLPATEIRGRGMRKPVAYMVRTRDAALIWGHRLRRPATESLPVTGIETV